MEDGESTHVENKIASISTRKANVVPSVNNQMMVKDEIPAQYRIQLDPLLMRPFMLGSANWSDTDPQYSLLSLPVRDLPADVLLSNKSLKQAIKVGSLMRPSLKIHVSLNGTLTHAGCLLIGILPPGISQNVSDLNYGNNFIYLINTMLTGPHVKLFANEATSAMLEVPWYCNTDMCEAYIEDFSTTLPPEVIANTPLVFNYDANSKSRGAGCYATIAALVLNPLRPGTASVPLTLFMEAIFDNFELAVPTPRFLDDNDWIPQSGKSLTSQVTTGLLDLAQVGGKMFYPYYSDAIDAARGLIRSFTGLHNPNLPSIDQRVITSTSNFHNNVDNPQRFERLDPLNNFNRIYKEPVFGTDIDEMSIKYICSKKQYLGTFSVSTTTPAGTLLFSRPISPFQGGGLGAQPYYQSGVDGKQVRLCSNNLELMHALHRYWRGGLNLEIESVMNNKSHCKLKIIKYYNPSQRILEDYPTMGSMSNAPSQLVEFSAGAQKYCVDLPYLHRNELMPCCEDATSEAFMHGVYLIYLAQPLIIGDGSPTTVSFNVFMYGSQDEKQGLQFYGYIHKDVELSALVPTSYNVGTDTPVSMVAQSSKWEPQSSQACMPSVKPMNEPQDPEKTIVSMFPDGVKETPNHFDRLVPNYDIRPLIRRMYKVYQSPEIVLNGVTVYAQEIPLSNIIGETYYPNNTPAFSNLIKPTNNIGLVAGMYYGKAGTGFKVRLDFHVYNQGDFANTSQVDYDIYYVPPTVTTDFSVFPDSTISYLRNSPNMQNFLDTSDIYKFPDTPRTLNVHRIGGFAFTEFFIPDISSFKFIGAPNKFYKYGNQVQTTNPASDLGSLVVRIRNYGAVQTVPANYTKLLYNVSVGLSDETRFGFHTIAPIYVIRAGLNATYVKRTTDGTVQYPSSFLPNTIYAGHPHAGGL